MKFSHRQLIIISGSIWLLIGVWLLNVGLRLLLGPLSLDAATAENGLFISHLGQMTGGKEYAVMLLIVLALCIGYLKGRVILGKSARKGVQRIMNLPNPASLASMYSFKYYIILALMIGLGISIKVLNVPFDLRGFIDTLIGAALINGAMVYFQYAAQLKKNYL